MHKDTAAALDHRLVRLEDPDFYSSAPSWVYRRLHKEAPVFWYEPVGFWVVSRHGDIREVSRNPVYTVTKGRVINDLKYGNATKSIYPQSAELLTMTDAPRHQALRRVVAPAFGPAAMKGIEHRVRTIARRLVADIEPGTPFDFVKAVSEPLPLLVIAELLGLRSFNLAQLIEWTDHVIEFANAAGPEELAASAQRTLPMKQFFVEEIEAQRTDPRGGVISNLLNADIEGEKLALETILMFCQLLTVAGNETTRQTLSAQLHLLLQNPDQMQRLRAEPKLGANAVDETVRMLSPFNGSMRHALEPVEIRGQKIRAGQAVYMLFPAGNRDEEVFEDPDRYDVGRAKASQHLGFSTGEHFCLGAPLARLEVRILFEELLSRFSSIELAGEPARMNKSLLINGYVSMPVMMKAA